MKYTEQQIEEFRDQYNTLIGKEILAPGAIGASGLTATLIRVSKSPFKTVDVQWSDGDKRIYYFWEVAIKPEKNRYWVSWKDFSTSRNFPNTTFQFWVSGHGAGCQTLVAVIDAVSEDEVWKRIRRHFRCMEERFIQEVAYDFTPGDRFPGFENRT